MRRLLYFGYYLSGLDRPKLAKFMAYVQDAKGWSVLEQWARILRDSLRFNVSILEYYQFRFFELSDGERAAWAGTGTMYEFQRRANPPGARSILEDKTLFLDAYRPFIRHDVVTLPEIERERMHATRVLGSHAQLVLKPARGNCGIGISFVESASMTADTLGDEMHRHGFDLVEERVVQHAALAALSPSGVNTVRIFTCLDARDRAYILGCRLRISVNSAVDNMAAGNLAAPIDDATGIVIGPGVYSDITRPSEAVHPVTGVAIEGFQIPFWEETVALARAAAERHPQNRSVGWDIAITPQGPDLIEGNHDWCKLVWQLPVGRGLKHLLGNCR
jgi:hypothetical protein